MIVDRIHHHNASAQVLADGADRSVFVWIADFLPDELAGRAAPLMEHALASSSARSSPRNRANNQHRSVLRPVEAGAAHGQGGDARAVRASCARVARGRSRLQNSAAAMRARAMDFGSSSYLHGHEENRQPAKQGDRRQLAQWTSQGSRPSVRPRHRGVRQRPTERSLITMQNFNTEFTVEQTPGAGARGDHRRPRLVVGKHRGRHRQARRRVSPTATRTSTTHGRGSPN